MTPTAVGIDLGTTFSVIATVNAANRPEIVANAEGKPITPSVIYFGCDPPLVGAQAKEKQALGESQVASFFKRSMGDPHFRVELGGQGRTAVDLSALVLKKLKADAERALKRLICQAVISVPAYFNNGQRQATIAAAQRAGLEVLEIINEPTAAALAYRVHETSRTETVLVYDLGGGTFDVTLVTVSRDELTVLATLGDHNLGGKDWDDRVAFHLARQFQEKHGIDPLEDRTAFNDLLVRCENAKQTLSARSSTRISLTHAGRSESIELTRVLFEELTCDLMERTKALCQQVLGEANQSWSQITGVLLVGGSTRMPMVHDYVAKMSGKQPMTGVNVDEAVALGAAIRAAQIIHRTAPPEQLLALPPGPRRTRDVMSHSLGMIAVSPDRSRYLNSIIVPKNKPIPCQIQRPYQLRTRARAANELEVYMTQGETETPSACSFLGKYRFTDIGHVEGNTAILDISYAYDANGVVQVSATQRSTGRTLPMTVEPVPVDMTWLNRPPRESNDHAHVTVYLAIDLSGSMNGRPLAEAQQAARTFVHKTDLAHCSVGLVSFADQVSTNIAASQNARHLEAAIAGMSIGPVGYGNDASPFADIHRMLLKVAGPRFIIVLTDGVWCNQARAVNEARDCHRDGIELIAIGFGMADEAFLRAIASSELDSIQTQLGNLVATFGKIAQELTETAGGLAAGRGKSRGLGI